MTFTPTAETLQPADPTFDVRYKLRSRNINNGLIFKNTYTIRVSALRIRSSVSKIRSYIFTACVQVFEGRICLYTFVVLWLTHYIQEI